jgi:hypothetical protein
VPVIDQAFDYLIDTSFYVGEKAFENGAPVAKKILDKSGATDAVITMGDYIKHKILHHNGYTMDDSVINYGIGSLRLAFKAIELAA